MFRRFFGWSKEFVLLSFINQFLNEKSVQNVVAGGFWLLSDFLEPLLINELLIVGSPILCKIVEKQGGWGGFGRLNFLATSRMSSHNLQTWWAISRWENHQQQQNRWATSTLQTWWAISTISNSKLIRARCRNVDAKFKDIFYLIRYKIKI